MKTAIECPNCGHEVLRYRNPIPTADIIIRVSGGIVLIKRKNPPHGWALPGGFIDYGESAEDAAKREALEETGLHVFDLRQFGVYSRPDRDPRHHTLTVVFTAKAEGDPVGTDDAHEAAVFLRENLPSSLAFDHAAIIEDFFAVDDSLPIERATEKGPQ
jgi:ADP-ribose pyrophosphatase YjhB (NUDIX family)